MLIRAIPALLILFRKLYRSVSGAFITLSILLLVWYTPLADAQPQFDNTLTLTDLQVGENILSVALDLIDPDSLIFQVDLQSITPVSEQTQAACIDPYFSFDLNQLIIPVLEVGDERYQAILDLIDAEQGLFQFNLASPLLTTVSNPVSPAFSVWQEGNNISLEWGSPNDGVDGYLVWYTPYQSGEPVVVEDISNFTNATNISVELPIEADYCLAMTSHGPDGDSEFSTLFRFTNFEVPYAAYNTDDPSLPALFILVRENNLFMMLMHDAGEDKPYGALIGNVNDDESIVVAIHPEHGLLRRITFGQFVYHFVNYTATTVDVIETVVDGETTVYPDLPLSNFAISVINTLIDDWEARDSQMLIFETEVARASLEQSIQNLQNLNVGLAIITLLNLDDNIEEHVRLIDSLNGDSSLSELYDTSLQALEDAEDKAEKASDAFCSGAQEIHCSLHTIHQPNAQNLIEENPEKFLDSFDLTLNVLQTVDQLVKELNRDCVTILDPIERADCEVLQGNPESGEQEELLSINGSLNAATAQEIERLLQNISLSLTNRKFESQSKFEAGEVEGEYLIQLDIPSELQDQVYGFEFIFGQQQPRWNALEFLFPDGLPPNMDSQLIPGGIQVFSSDQIPDGLIIKVKATADSQVVRIELTDKEHERLGYVMATPGTIDTTPKFESQSIFEFENVNNRKKHIIKLDIPSELEGRVFDFEIFDLQQQPTWLIMIPDLNELPPGLEVKRLGTRGYRFFSENPLPDNLVVVMSTPINNAANMVRIELTGEDHETLGYVMATPGTVNAPQNYIEPCTARNFVVNWNNGLWDPDTLILNCNGNALLGGFWQGQWTQNGSLMMTFDDGSSTVDAVQPAPGNLCYTNGNYDWFGNTGSTVEICPQSLGPLILMRDGRFHAQASRSDPPGGEFASGFPLTNNSGGFSFFAPDEPIDLHVEIFDGCSVNNHYWIFADANTNVEYTLTVTDTQTEQEWVYHNEFGNPIPTYTDTEAFATCP